ncbi:TPA: hypothetical protein R0J32_004990 [Klebsiella quasipneumoniae]|uniref:hypothetical protein n=1 Tax=Klebsiella pneumoniae TaxID=573 RepID=UPI0013041625|nr:hypothetical protein [Klebsiella pneumoniae]DAL51700.1 MAG TPA_asm: hypothetical protein [Caudoviricetes sp.]HDS3205201.1 hypothetical protein [Klebsiella pneumoniae subsp. pneumoniae]HEB4939122.1 hypothetical protein [Klebsiella quasipneumoniae]HEL4785678.1 hypothetical protein [Klebsiella pneumoniae]
MNSLYATYNTLLFIAGIIFFGGAAYSLWIARRKKMSLLYCSVIPIFIVDIYLAWAH